MKLSMYRNDFLPRTVADKIPCMVTSKGDLRRAVEAFASIGERITDHSDNGRYHTYNLESGYAVAGNGYCWKTV